MKEEEQVICILFVPAHPLWATDIEVPPSRSDVAVKIIASNENPEFESPLWNVLGSGLPCLFIPF
jgi:hypothetical protein